MLLTLCIACQYGDHDGHVEIIEPVAEGVMGGASCPCTGDCHDNGPPPTRIGSAPPMPDLSFLFPEAK